MVVVRDNPGPGRKVTSKLLQEQMRRVGLNDLGGLFQLKQFNNTSKKMRAEGGVKRNYLLYFLVQERFCFMLEVPLSAETCPELQSAVTEQRLS